MSGSREPTGPSVWASPDLARAYAEVRTALPAPVREVWAEAFRAAIPPVPLRRLLDVGCGTGRFTALLGDVFGRPTLGVDGSPAMLHERVAAAHARFLAADAPSLPLRDACVDLALLSMVYHLLAPPAATVREIHRVVAPGRWVLVRTPTLEILDRISYLRFFPAARAIDDARMPSRARVAATFEGEGFVVLAQRTIEQEFARSPADALAKLRRRPFSNLRLIADEAFADGLARFEAACRRVPATPVIEPLDLFVFERR